MYLDILIFAVIAAYLVYRLNGVLGTRHGEERQRPNPFAAARDAAEAARRPAQAADTAAPVIEGEAQEIVAAPLAFEDPLALAEFVDPVADREGKVREGLQEIAAADPSFDLSAFIGGARAAFDMIVNAYAQGDLDTLKPLLSEKLLGDFRAGVAAREKAGHRTEITVHRIKAARVLDAHMGGTMAYITVDFTVEQTTVTYDRDGHVVEGDPDQIYTVEDIWTFTRDTRVEDPNWLLIETRAGDTDG